MSTLRINGAPTLPISCAPPLSNAATIGLLDDRIAFGHFKGCTRKYACDRKLRRTWDRLTGVRDGLTSWNASVELGGRVRGDLDVESAP